MAACGTTAGYEAHKRRGDERCDPCWAAIADYRRKRRNGTAGPARTRNPIPALAREFDCPKCGAAAGEYCVTGRISRLPTYAVCIDRVGAYQAEVG